MNTTTHHLAEFSVELPFNVTDDEARLAMAVRLFEKGRVSLGQAASLAGFSKRAFIDVLGREGVAVVNYPAGELEKELAR
jgi:predicted HTH domain antitoxin